MENFSYNSSYPDSVNSSPRSREVDLENSSWDEPISSANYKVKFMCSYGGKIHPRPHDNQLTYVGGDTKIFSVDRNTKYSGFISKLSSLCDVSDVCFKYQLPGEDLDALISVTNDEDLEHMMLEYDRLHRSSAKPARLRLFIFPLTVPASASSFGSNDSKSERQWFVDALNSVQLNQNMEDSSTPSAAAAAAAADDSEVKKDPDFLFGLEKGHPQPTKMDDPLAAVAPTVMVAKGFSGGPEERHVIGEPVMPPPEFQRQLHDFQRMQISSHEQGTFNRKFDDYYSQEKAPGPPPPPQPQQLPQPQPAVPMPNPAAYWKERHEPFPAGTNEQPVYLIQTPSGVYHAPAPPMRPVTGQVSQAYYGVQRMVPEVYREQQMFNAVVPPVSSTLMQQQPKMGGPYTAEGIGGLVRPPVPEAGYGQVGYDVAGRQVYYAAAGHGPGGLMQQPPPPYTAVPQVVAGGIDVRQIGGAINQEGKMINKTP